MPRYKDIEHIRKLFDNEYKSTRKLINEGEKHLDNLAEGFSEATRVLDMLPTADVVPRSEVKELILYIERHLGFQRKQYDFPTTSCVTGSYKCGVMDMLNYFDEIVAEFKKKYIGEGK